MAPAGKSTGKASRNADQMISKCRITIAKGHTAFVARNLKFHVRCRIMFFYLHIFYASLCQVDSG